jgi:hypothetical protein
MERTLNKLAVVLVTTILLFGLVLAPVMAGAVAEMTSEGPVLIQLEDEPAGLLADPVVGGRSGA